MSSKRAAETALEILELTHAEHIGSGMEGHVFRVRSGLVAKVWHDKALEALEPLRQFYDVILGLNLPFATPDITAIERVGDRTVSIERALDGLPLQDFVDPEDEHVPQVAIDAVIGVLSALQSAKLRLAADHLPDLPILGVTLSGATDIPGTTRLLEIAEGKVATYGNHLRASVPNFEQITLRVSNLRVQTHCAIHGDICTPNVLINEIGQVSAVLDWGFASCFGDPAFDASVACGIYNMYGPHHRKLDDTLLDACVSRLGHSRNRLLIYRALYAVLTSNAYSEDGTDGHFDWCVEQLNRDDVQEALSQSTID
ncbi:MAG: aminoglycoside phosphotransferase family protein [Thermomicrobiales bacterium]